MAGKIPVRESMVRDTAATAARGGENFNSQGSSSREVQEVYSRKKEGSNKCSMPGKDAVAILGGFFSASGTAYCTYCTLYRKRYRKSYQNYGVFCPDSCGFGVVLLGDCVGHFVASRAVVSRGVSEYWCCTS